VLAFVRDITDREVLRQETEDRLVEINSLYKVMSRDSWKQFQSSFEKMPAYIYDQTSVVPAGDTWMELDGVTPGEKALAQSLRDVQIITVPLSLRGDEIGTLAIQTSMGESLTPEETQLLQEMTDQIALALESARLFFQTQQALGETQTLYSIIAEMNSAQDYSEILEALSSRTVLSQADQLLIMAVFDQPLRSGTRPEWIFPVAHRAGEGIQVAQRYPVNAFEAIPATLFTDQPVVLSDLAGDQRLDRVSRTLFQDIFQAKSSVILPLMLADQSIGFVQGYFGQVTHLSQEEIQRLSAVASQAAIAVQSRLLLEQAQARARQEARIRDVTTQVFSATDVDTIMRRAVEQVGKILKLPAFIYLGKNAEGELGQNAANEAQEEK
jgi:GAF domain-containing protein